MIWLVFCAVAAAWLFGVGCGIALSWACQRGDDRTGMVDLTGVAMDPHLNAQTAMSTTGLGKAIVAASAGAPGGTPVVESIRRETGGDQSAA